MKILEIEEEKINQIERPLPNSTAATFFSAQLNPRRKENRFPQQKALLGKSKFSKQLNSNLGNAFNDHAKKFNKNGVLVLNAFYQQHISEIQTYYQEALSSYGNYNPAMNIKGFSGSASKGTTLPANIADLLISPTLLGLLSQYAGAPVTLQDFRGYTSYPNSPLRIRAWGWHNDGVLGQKKSAEFKLMIILNDIDENGQPMLYVPQSVREWEVTHQRDTNFTPEEMRTHIKDNQSSIVQCFGEKGTAILFDGEGIHCATRGNEKREVLVMTFTHAGPEASIFPIAKITSSIPNNPNLTSITFDNVEISEEDLLKEFSDSSSQIERELENYPDTSSSQTLDSNQSENLITRYAETPTINDIKPRLDSFGIFKSAQSVDKFIKIFLTDLHADLDLPANPGSQDIGRDTLRIQYREIDPNHTKLRRARSRYLELNPSITDISNLKSIDFFRECLSNFINYLRSQECLVASDNSQLGGNFKNNINRYQAALNLAADLKEAFSHCEFTQDIRTNVLFLYALYDEAAETYQDNNLENVAAQILGGYFDLIKLDDNYYSNLELEDRSKSLVGYNR